MGGKPGLDVTVEDWDKALNVNSRGLFFMMQQVVAQSMAERGGSIINFASMAGIRGMHPPMCSAFYSASKGAVVAVTMQAAVEWAGLGVRVNCVAPGGVETPAMREMGFPQEAIDALALLTHDPEVPYMEYVSQIAKNPVARAVKIADLKHNSDLSRLDSVDEKILKRREKYLQALALLE